MHELISVVAFFSGVTIFIIGWVMSVVAAKNFGTKWIVGMILAFPITLLLLVLIHWGSAKKPLLFTVTGTVFNTGNDILRTRTGDRSLHS